jgi:hypothetical protein
MGGLLGLMVRPRRPPTPQKPPHQPARAARARTVSSAPVALAKSRNWVAPAALTSAMMPVPAAAGAAAPAGAEVPGGGERALRGGAGQAGRRRRRRRLWGRHPRPRRVYRPLPAAAPPRRGACGTLTLCGGARDERGRQQADREARGRHVAGRWGRVGGQQRVGRKAARKDMGVAQLKAAPVSGPRGQRTARSGTLVTGRRVGGNNDAPPAAPAGRYGGAW